MGGGTYYLAKRTIVAESRERYAASKQRSGAASNTLPAASPPPSQTQRTSAKPRKPAASSDDQHMATDHAGRPSAEASADPAPAGGADKSAKRTVESSPWEPKEPYRSSRGDRFSSLFR